MSASSDRALARKARAALRRLAAQEAAAKSFVSAIESETHLPCTPPVVDGLELRRRLGRKRWGVPESHGCCGWLVDNLLGNSRIIVTGDHMSGGADGVQWIHASISRPIDMPTYDNMVTLASAVFGDDKWAYQVFAPRDRHINIHKFALHLFGRADGQPALPDFGRHGTI